MTSLRLRLLTLIRERENLDLPTNKSAITAVSAGSPRTAARHWAVLDDLAGEGLLWKSAAWPAQYRLTSSGVHWLALNRPTLQITFREAQDANRNRLAHSSRYGKTNAEN